jgi:ATP-dependent DNA helicase PIF1
VYAWTQVNGATGIVTAVTTDHGGYVTSINVKLDSTGAEKKISRVAAATKRIGDVMYSVKTFPLQLCYAITAHKCQGMTLKGKTICHIRNAFAPGIVYVMLSRLSNRKKLVVLDELTPDMIVPLPLNVAAA